MKIKTPAMKLDLRIDKMEVRDGELVSMVWRVCCPARHRSVPQRLAV
jgi:hypothetical protein